MKFAVIFCMVVATGFGAPSNSSKPSTPVPVLPTKAARHVGESMCYSCNSGWDVCGAEGITTDLELVGQEACRGNCFVRLDKSGYIYRGCTDSFPDLESTPENGCIQADEDSYGDSVEEWCFCTTNLCNHVGFRDLGGNGPEGPTPAPGLPCPALDAPDNGYVAEEDGNRVTFGCDQGYVLEDRSSRTRTCKPDGTWTGTAARCIPKRCNAKIDLVYAVDTSCSIAERNLEKINKFVEEATDLLDIRRNRVQVGAVGFNKGYQHFFYLNTHRNKNRVMNAIRTADRKLEGCRTNTWMALKALRDTYFSQEHGARLGVKKVAAVITDGFTYPRRNRRDTAREALLNNKAGIETFVIGVANKRGRFGTEEWEAIASEPKEDHVIKLDSFDQLQEVVQVLRSSAC